MVLEMKKRSLSLDSHAKINLFLEVVSKRPDDYHNIRTIFHEIALSDTINFTLTKNRDIRILTNKHFVSLEENLIYKVAVFIQKQYNVLNGVAVELVKNIPISAGLGGGSSNAATTVLALSELWDLNLSEKEMHQIAAGFGSDINFFLQGGTSLGEGRGEQISGLKNVFIDNIFLVKPSFGISSKEAYDEVVIYSDLKSNLNKFLDTEDTIYCQNQLEKGIVLLYPEVREIIDQVKLLGASNAILSGSGSTIIGFCPNRMIAESLTDYYSKRGYWNCITKSKKRSTL